MPGLKPKLHTQRCYKGCVGCESEGRYYGAIARRRKAKARRKSKNRK